MELKKYTFISYKQLAPLEPYVNYIKNPAAPSRNRFGEAREG